MLEAIREHGLASGCLIGTYERPDTSIKTPVDADAAPIAISPPGDLMRRDARR